MNDDDLPPSVECGIEIFANIVAMVPLYYLAGYLHSALEPRVAAFVHWLGWFSP
jgi:hypothetical protein